jgi:hypothetical protein
MDNDTVLDAPQAPAQAPTAPAAPAAAPAPATPSLRETLEAAVAKTPIETERDGTAEQTQRVRDGQGRFTRRNADGTEVPSEEQVKQASLSLDPNVPLEDEEGDQQQQREDPLPSMDNAPKSWKGVAKEKWAGVDPVIRAEVHRRERDMQRAISEHAPVRKFVENFTQVINPFAQHYAQTNLPPLQLFQNLMSADVHLSTAPAPQRAQFMAKLIKDYGIDITMLDAALAGEDPGTGVNAGLERMLEERLAPVNEFLHTETQRRQATVQAERQRAETVLDRMERDIINFPHFALVAQDMADITEMALKRRIYLTPQDAYARAVAMNPEAQAAEQSRSGQQRAQVAHDAATRSLGASLSVSGSPAGLKESVAPSDLRGTIEAAWQAAQGR